jgi:cell wall-associated NlpC family hydrolase
MWIWVKPTVAALLCGLSLHASWAQEVHRRITPSSANQGRNSDRTLSPDDGLPVIAAALDFRASLYSERDCSHLVHAIYERAGFHYSYASSSDLYVGIEEFQRTMRPQPGDLVVWRGHVGIVIKPSRHIFFSLMRAGPGIDDYEAPYWTSRGPARFYRYVKSDPCAGCVAVHARPTGLK